MQRMAIFDVFRNWIMIGVQSFGGGSATLELIRRTAVDKYAWVSGADFVRDWAIVQAAPGINLLALTILIGKRIAGLRGALAALLGLMLPSIGLTILMTAFYAQIRALPLVEAALRGVVPATAGLGLLLSINMARPLVQASWQDSRVSFCISVLILTGSVLAVLVLNIPVLYVLLSAGLLGAASAMWKAQYRAPA